MQVHMSSRSSVQNHWHFEHCLQSLCLPNSMYDDQPSVCLRDLDIFKLQLFVLHNTDTISFPLFNSLFLRYNKQQHTPQSDLWANPYYSNVCQPQHRWCFSSILAKAAVLRINLNLDGTPITSKSHTHPSHTQTSRLLTSSLSLGVPVPRPTQCIRGV
jgi:hypothetical protein